MKITKTKNGTYSVNLYKNGKRKHITGKSYQECKNTAVKWLNFNNFVKTDKLLIKQAIQNYIDLSGSILSPTTIKSYKTIFNNYLQSIMMVNIHELTSELLQKAINEDLKRVSAKTVGNALGLLSAALDEYDISLPRHKLPQKIKKSIYIPTKEEVKKFIDASSGDLNTAIVFAIYLGLRRSEICALQKKDFDGKNLHITKALVKGDGGKYVVKVPKTTESTRVLAVPKVLIPYIDKLPISKTPDTLTKEFIELRNELNVPMRFHDLRHYFVSSLMAKSVDYSYIRSYTGHKSNNMINLVYGHQTPERQKEVVDILNDILK